MIKNLFKKIFNGQFDWVDMSALCLLLGIIAFFTRETWAPVFNTTPRIVPPAQRQVLPPPPPVPDQLPTLPEVMGGGDAAPVVSTDADGLPPIPQVTIAEHPADEAPLEVTVETVIALQQQIAELRADLDARPNLRMDSIVAAVVQELPATGTSPAAPFKMTPAIKKEIEDNVAWYYKNRPLPQAVKVEIEHKAAWYAEREVNDQLESRFKSLFDKYFSAISEPLKQ